MGPPSYIRSVVDRNVVMRLTPVHKTFYDSCRLTLINTLENKGQKLAFLVTKLYKLQLYVVCKYCNQKTETFESLSPTGDNKLGPA
jgi:hypothetical protein